MEVLGYIASLLIGLSLGLIGGGGSILTVPVLVYLFGINPLLATSYSLFIVGLSSLVGAINNFREGLVNIKVAGFFGLTSVISVFITRKFIVHNLPEKINIPGIVPVSTSSITMILFAVLMIAASYFMIRNKKDQTTVKDQAAGQSFKLIFLGVGIGFVTGLLGAGGGFLLIPALVLILKLPIKEAVGTSLLIIAMNSLSGFVFDLGHFKIDWQFMFTISVIAITGIFVGGMLSKKIEGAKLKKAFGWFVLFMGAYIFIREIIS